MIPCFNFIGGERHNPSQSPFGIVLIEVVS